MTNENRLPRGVVLLRSEFWKKLSLKLIEVSVFNIYFSHSFHILFLIDQMKGFVSIFQHLGRCIRRIFTVFRPDLTTRDKQHVRLLHNLEVHKPCMRKTYSSVHLTEPLRRIIEPHCRIIEPLWRNVEPHCGIIEPLRRIIEPHCGIIEPLWRNVEPHCGIIEPLRRNIEPHCGIIEPVWRNIEHRIKENHDRLSHCRNVESVYGINKSFAENHNLTLQGESAWQTTVRKSFSDRETVDMKAVVNDYVSSSEIIIPGSCDELMLDVSNDRSSNQPSTAVYRLTVRKLCKQSKINRHRHSRNREPSRIPVKKVIQTMRKRKLRQKLKRILRKSTPASSKLFHLITNYKLWYIDYIHRNLDSFYTAYFRFQLSCACKNNSKNIKNKQYSVSDMKLLLSGDIEMNPGPVENVVSKSIVFSPQNNMLLATRLYRHGLRPLDVGGGGDCFFRAVAHQLYGDPKFHLNIRALAVQYLSDHPERFIESNSENSWLEYLANISQQGTWCDNLIIQALADKLNIRIHITESNPLFAEISVIEPVHFTTDIQTIHLGHIDELHYVSTVPFNFVPMSVINDTVLVMSETNSTLSKENDLKRKHNAYMREYRKKRKTDTDKQKSNAYMREYKKTREDEKRLNYNTYMREYRASKQSKQNNHLPQVNDENPQKQPKSLNDMISKFHRIVNNAPLYVCSCCDQLWYKHSVSSTAKLRERNPNVDKYLLNKTSVDNIEWVCTSCNKYLSKNKVPPCAIVNGMQFLPKPAFFDLNELECRLLAPRLAFQKLMQAPRGGQLKINGNIVNVPADVNTTISILPRLPHENGTINVNLKRRLQYKGSALSLNVTPHKVLQAAHWLLNNSSLYQEEGIVLNENWIANISNVLSDECHNDQPEDPAQDIDNGLSATNQKKSLNEEDDWSEDEVEIPVGVTDTMLTATDFLGDTERQYVLNVAPGEGNIPLSVFRDKYSEELAYPGIFLGQKRPDNDSRITPVHYSEICKSELRRSDRRAAICVENIFFKTKKLQMKILLGKSQVALRKCHRNNRLIKAGQLKQQGAIEKLIHHDEGFKFLRALRGSPPYFQKAKKDLFAMIRQLGSASLFCSFSSAETQWIHLLRILGQLVDKKEYTDNELENLNWQEKCRLIQSDPVTCARHFDYQINQFLRNFLLSDAAPLGKIADWFYRVEYQQRGSPHIHMLIWLENAPTFGIDSDKNVIAFINKVITCQKPTDNPDLLKLVNRQIHRHSHTCRKKSKTECRFNYPQPPMKATTILYPIDVDEEAHNQLKQLKEIWKKIKKQLNDMKEGEDITVDKLLLNLNVSEETYLLAIRSNLNSPTIFLKRQPNELRVNNYNASCLSAWRANMDIQFVLDIYACAMYIVSYISKAQKGISEILRVACDEARKGNASIKQQVRDIGNKFLNNVEISAQEAVYIVLQLPMRKSSRQIVFVNTSPPEDRVKLLKCFNDIKEMEDDSDDIYASGLLDRYTKRPAKLEHLTLADWAAWYDLPGKPYVKKSFETDTDDLLLETSISEQENDDDDDDDPNGTYQTEFKCQKNKRRLKARIIRSVGFNKVADPEKHYRELIMLFTSWRNENTDLIGNCSSYQEHCLLLKAKIDEQMKLYAVCSQDLNEIEEQLSNMEENDDSCDMIAPNTQNIELQDEAEGAQDLHPELTESYDLSEDIGIPSTTANTEQLILNEVPDDEYRRMVQILNKEQKEFFYHILHLMKTSNDPFYCFLSGGTGVGKSHVTKALYQAALKYYNTRAGDDFHQVKVLMLAPTGKAAYNIKGNTLHSALAIPACQSLKDYKSLDSSRLNTLRCQLGGVKLIYLDEISMVRNTMFNVQVNNRLKDIKGSKDDFGGVSIIAIGDLFQLQPVMDGYIFKDLDNSEYSILAPNLWQKHFKMFELHEIMRQRESKVFAEILNRLREGNHTIDDIVKLKERIFDENTECNLLMDIPHLFIQNKKVNDFNEKVHHAAKGEKYTIKSQDSVIGANSSELRDKIMKQIPDDPRKTKQIVSNLHLAEGERTELAMNIRTEDGMTNGAGNVVKKVQLHQKDKPSGIIWVLFDHADVGEKTRYDNKHLYVQGIQSTWTPIKPITTQFAVGRNRTAQVVRKQFPLRPAAAKTIHRSQGDTESRIVVNFDTTRAIPHIHYVGLSRVTTIEGLHITNLCENKIAVSPHVQTEMKRLRNSGRLNLSVLPLYTANSIPLKICYLNARSLHRHIEDIRKDLNYSSTDISIFSETRFTHSDHDSMYTIDGYSLFRNDGQSNNTTRPFGGTAVYSSIQFIPGHPYCFNRNGVEMTIIKCMYLPHITIIGIYRSPKVAITQFCIALRQVLSHTTTQYNVFIGDFNLNWLNETDRVPLYNLFITEHNYRQLVSLYTTDNKTAIDHIYTNLPESQVQLHLLETYFSDHKSICALINCFNTEI